MEEDQERFAAEVTRCDGTAVIAVQGEIDVSTAPELRRVIEASIDDGARIEVDLRHTTFMDSTGLAVLVDANRRLGNGRGPIVVHHPQPRVSRVLEISGIAALLDIRDGNAPEPPDNGPISRRSGLA